MYIKLYYIFIVSILVDKFSILEKLILICPLVSKLKETVNPRKWLCVGVEEVKVENIGDLVIVIMNDTHKETLTQNFNNLAK